MRRIKLVLALTAVMTAMLVAFAGPAAAADECRFLADGRVVCDDNNGFDFFNPFDFGGGVFFDVAQDIDDTGEVLLGVNVS